MADVMDLPPDPPLIRDDKRRERKERSLDDRSRRDRDPRDRREDDDRVLRRDYVDRRSDDDRPGSALGRDRERDYKRRRSPSPSPPPLQRSRRDDDHDGGRRGSPRDRRIVSGPSQSNALVADERSHLKLRGVRSDSGKVGHMDASETGTRRDGLMTYKQFISELNDDISPAESELRYSEYQKKAFFEQNKQDWFRHKYDPSRSEAMIQGIWIRKACKIHDEYKIVKDIAVSRGFDGVNTAQASTEGAPPLALPAATDAAQSDSKGQESALAVVVPQPLGRSEPGLETMAVPPSSTLSEYRPPERSIPSAAIMKRLPSRWPRPVWHPPWKNYRVISGHLGWVRSIAFDPGNEWFCTGSADRTIKIWDLGSGQLKLTLTGHIEQVRGLAVSSKFPYMFSAGDDKQVKCWDLEYNKVIRSYHGHLSGVYCLSLHPTQDILLTGGRDSVCRVWDMRTKAQVHALSGHENTVCSVITQAKDPQVVTGSHDTTIKLWDLAAGKSISTLTFHKKSVRALAMHPFENSFASASADNIKKFRLPKGEFLHNMLAAQRTIVNCMAVNEENVLASGGDNGSIWWWDWKSGHNFQQVQTIVQPGSLDSEAGIYALSYDITGTRLVTCETDKTIKMWKEDEDATPETHPINFKPPKDMRRF